MHTFPLRRTIGKMKSTKRNNSVHRKNKVNKEKICEVIKEQNKKEELRARMELISEIWN